MEAKIIILDEIADEVRKSLGLLAGDTGLFCAMLKFMKIISNASSIEDISDYLLDENNPLCVWRLKQPFIYCLRENYLSSFDDKGNLSKEYADWVETYGRILLTVSKLSKEYDGLIQHILNWEDFLFLELQHTAGGKKIICEFYDIRGIDFFLSHFLGSPTTDFSDSPAFENAMIVPQCLHKTGRDEEAILVSKEINERQKRLKNILSEYSSPKSSPLPSSLDFLRLQAERFWVDYLSNAVWSNTSQISKQDLIDSFVAEFLLQKGILRGWSQAVLSLCKVIEREMANILFTPWVDFIQSGTFSVPENLSRTQVKRVKSRKMTFQVLQSCAKHPSHPPTLGQLLFVAKFWNDNLMNQCCTTFCQMREKADKESASFSDQVAHLTRLLEESHEVGEEQPTITELRNAAAHPGKENDFTWAQYVGWLKELLGKPPRDVLRLLIEMKKIVETNHNTSAQQLHSR